MEAYTDFAEVYDIFMDETPYQKWADFLARLIEEYGISKPVRVSAADKKEGSAAKEAADEDIIAEDMVLEDRKKALETERNLVLDLGCGTGTLTELLYEKGYDMIGIDNSQEMLNIAMNKRMESGSEILYLCQDMRDLDLYSTVGTVVSVCDSLNYLLEEEDVLATFEKVHNYLYPGGIFIFDFNTVYKYREVIGDTTIAENRDDCSFIWENYYHEEEGINEYDLTIFVREEEGKESFRRFFETHYQRGYTVEEMKAFVKKAGMEPVLILDADTRKVPTKESERIYMIARGRK